MPEHKLTRLRRRDFLKGGALALVGYSMAKAGFSYSNAPSETAPTAVLTPSQAQTVRLAAARLNGPDSETSLEAGMWNPVATFDEMLLSMPADQQSLLAVGLSVFEHGRIGLSPFSMLSVESQLAHLENFRTSSLAMKRGIWGVLRAGSALSYCGSEAGWAAIGYPGPCMPSGNHPGRAPGQSVRFKWDESVP